MARKRIKPIVDVIPGYTAKQSMFLRGEISIDEVDGRFFRFLLERAKANNDKDTIETAQALLNYCQEEAKQRNCERARERTRCIYHGEEIAWKQPKSTEYTERQKQIARNEIPLDKLHGNELASLCKKARANGDSELADMIYDLILERREDEKAKRLKHLYDRKATVYYDDKFEGRDYLTSWEEAVLNNDADPEECSTKHLEHILDIVKKENNEKYIKTAERMVAYRHDPTVCYITHNTEEALRIIEQVIGLPIRRKNTWFA